MGPVGRSSLTLRRSGRTGRSERASLAVNRDGVATRPLASASPFGPAIPSPATGIWPGPARRPA